jgi:K+-transporting ATPase KdpF subunit
MPFGAMIEEWLSTHSRRRGHGCRFSDFDRRVLRPDGGVGRRVRPVERGRVVTMLYAVGGLAALGLLAYLLVAMLKPEIFP